MASVFELRETGGKLGERLPIALMLGGRRDRLSDGTGILQEHVLLTDSQARAHSSRNQQF